ncbi:hypothetical protein BN1723_010664, partial [Verticillium longisporum]
MQVVVVPRLLRIDEKGPIEYLSNGLETAPRRLEEEQGLQSNRIDEPVDETRPFVEEHEDRKALSPDGIGQDLDRSPAQSVCALK